MKKEDLKPGTEVYIKFTDDYKKAVVIEPTRELHHPKAVMVRVPILFEDGEELVDVETFPDLLSTFDEIKVNTYKLSESKLRIYISGPISGHDIDERRAEFQRVEYEMVCRGYEPVNPMKNGLPAEATIHEHMKRDIELLMTCDYIYMMRRWTHSKGCKVEFDVATAIGLPVFFEESGEITKFE